MEEAPERGSTTEALVEERRAKRDALRARASTRTRRASTAPTPRPSCTSATTTWSPTPAPERTSGWPAGSRRIRGHGKLVFATLQDVSGGIQLLMSALEARRPTPRWSATSLDLGDWIGAEGEVITSRRGELSVDVTRCRSSSKALRPLPDKWHGLSDDRHPLPPAGGRPAGQPRHAGGSSTSASRRSPPSAGLCPRRASSRWTRRSSRPRPGAPWPGRS